MATTARGDDVTSIDEAIEVLADELLAEATLHHIAKANERLRGIARTWGLGVAVLTAWRHGLAAGHILVRPPANPGAEDAAPPGPGVHEIPPQEPCPYTFVHVPIRGIRGVFERLAELGIVNPDPDPSGFIYHEDGLIGRLSFRRDHRPDGLTDRALVEILGELKGAGLLVQANLGNRQIQFKDLRVRRRIERSGTVYVRTTIHELTPVEVAASVSGQLEAGWAAYIAGEINRKRHCNYCSVEVMYPRETTIHTAQATVVTTTGQRRKPTKRNYRLGFTFAPFGHPEAACHFLAWDFPHISDIVNNMDPRSYSFSDLIKLVKQINQDIKAFCEVHQIEVPPAISGSCNHWAGNSIYHQHYQFFRLPKLPLLDACANSKFLAASGSVEVRRVLAWDAPAYLITSTGPDRADAMVMQVADKVARGWRSLNQGVVNDYGNGIEIKNHTQNIFVTDEGGRLTALFIPRLRKRINATCQKLPEGHQEKRNAGVLEMMGYFIIDRLETFQLLEQMSAEDRESVGDEWLRSLSPDESAIDRFEDDLKTTMDASVAQLEHEVEALESLVNVPGGAPVDSTQKVIDLTSLDLESGLESGPSDPDLRIME